MLEYVSDYLNKFKAQPQTDEDFVKTKHTCYIQGASVALSFRALCHLDAIGAMGWGVMFLASPYLAEYTAQYDKTIDKVTDGISNDTIKSLVKRSFFKPNIRPNSAEELTKLKHRCYMEGAFGGFALRSMCSLDIASTLGSVTLFVLSRYVAELTSKHKDEIYDTASKIGRDALDSIKQLPSFRKR